MKEKNTSRKDGCKLEQDPARETGPVPYSHQSHLGAWQPGLSADETQISSGREGEPNWDLHIICKGPYKCHQGLFLRNWLFLSLPSVQVLPIYLFLPVFGLFVSTPERNGTVNHSARVVRPLLFSFHQGEWKNTYFKKICKYFSWLFQFNCQIKNERKRCRQCHCQYNCHLVLCLHLQVFIFVTLMIKNQSRLIFKKKNQFILEGIFYFWKSERYCLNHMAQCA